MYAYQGGTLPIFSKYSSLNSLYSYLSIYIWIIILIRLEDLRTVNHHNAEGHQDVAVYNQLRVVLCLAPIVFSS